MGLFFLAASSSTLAWRSAFLSCKASRSFASRSSRSCRISCSCCCCGSPSAPGAGEEAEEEESYDEYDVSYDDGEDEGDYIEVVEQEGEEYEWESSDEAEGEDVEDEYVDNEEELPKTVGYVNSDQYEQILRVEDVLPAHLMPQTRQLIQQQVGGGVYLDNQFNEQSNRFATNKGQYDEDSKIDWN